MDNNRNSKTNRESLGQRINATIGKLNTTTKLFLLFLYTVILVVSTVIVTQAFSKNRFLKIYKNYDEVTENENVFVAVRLNERRSMFKEKEASYYDFNVTVYEKPNVEIQQVKLEHVVITKDGKSIFGDTAAKSPSTSSHFVTFSLSPSPRKTISDNIDETPDTLYLKVMYKVGIEGQTTKQDKELLIKEKLDYETPDDTKYKPRTLDSSGNIDTTLFTYTFKMSGSSVIILPKAKEANQIKVIRLSTIIKVANEATDVNNVIDENFLVYSYYGSFNSTIDPRTYYFTLDAKYNPGTVYVKAEIEKYGQAGIEEVYFKFEYSSILVE